MLTPTPPVELVDPSSNPLWVPLVGVAGVLLGAILGALLQSRLARKTARRLHDLQRQDEAAFQVADYLVPILEHVREFLRIYGEPGGRESSRIDSEISRCVEELRTANEIWTKRRLRVRDRRLRDSVDRVMSLVPAPQGDVSDASAVREWEDWLRRLSKGLTWFLQELDRVTQQ